MRNEPPSLFDRLVRHYLFENHLPKGVPEFKKQIFLLVVSLSGAYNYALPAKIDAEANDKSMLYNNWLLSVTCTCWTAVVVLYKATDIFLNMRANEQVPEVLSNVLSSKSKSMRYREDFLIGLGSFISAVPLTTTVLTYQKSPIPVLVLLVIMIQFDNTVLHFLPFKLVIKDPIFRLPFLPFEWIYWTLRTRCLLPEHARDEALEAQKQHDIATLKQLMINRLSATQKRLIAQSFRLKDFGYEVAPPEIVRQIATHDVALCEKEVLGQLLSIPARDPSHDLWRAAYKLSYLLGGLWVSLSCIGYLANPYTLLSEKLGNRAGAMVLTAFPIYALLVLLIYFGGNMLQDSYRYLTVHGSQHQKISPEIKLHPKLFTVLTLMSIGITFFSYAAAVQMFHDNFSEHAVHGGARTFLIGAIISGIAFLVINAQNDFWKLMLGKSDFFWGNTAAKQLIRFNWKMNALKSAIALISDERFKSEVEVMSGDKVQEIFGIEQKEIDQKLDHESNLGGQSSICPQYLSAAKSCCGSFWRSSHQPAGDRETLLKNGDVKDGYSIHSIC